MRSVGHLKKWYVMILTPLLIGRNNCANYYTPIFLKEALQVNRRVVIVGVQRASTWSGELCLIHQPVTNIDCSDVCLLVFVPTVNLEHQHNSRDCTTYTEDLDAMFGGFCRHVLYECNRAATVFDHRFNYCYVFAGGPYLL